MITFKIIKPQLLRKKHIKPERQKKTQVIKATTYHDHHNNVILQLTIIIFYRIKKTIEIRIWNHQIKFLNIFILMIIPIDQKKKSSFQPFILF